MAPVTAIVDGFDAITFDVVNELGDDIEVIQVDEGTQALVANEHDRWTAIDVDGTTVLIIEGGTDPDQFGDRHAEMQTIVDSILFDRPGMPDGDPTPDQSGRPAAAP